MIDSYDGIDEVDEAIARALLATQFPQWADLPLSQVHSSGTDHTLYRLSETLAMRLPKSEQAAHQSTKEQLWLSRLVNLPIPIPEIIGVGKPDKGFPFSWAVVSWLAGENATQSDITDWQEAAKELGGFVSSLQTNDAIDAPAAGPQNAYRGVALSTLTDRTHQAINDLADIFDAAALRKAWGDALAIPVWSGPPVWLHGDIHAGNIIVNDGRISGIIDFGLMGSGDPACDLTLAWSFLPASARPIFRDATQVDAATWERGKGWALYFGVVALSYYRDRNPILASIAKQSIEAVEGSRTSP